MTTININLLPEEMRPGGGGSSSGGGGAGLAMDRAALVPIVAGGIVALVIGAVPYAVDTFYLQPWADAQGEKEQEITNEINKYQTTLGELKRKGEYKETLRGQLATLQMVAGISTGWGDILNELRSITPANLWFDSMKTDGAKGTITLSGAALDYSSVSYLHRNLEKSEYFYNPVLGKTEQIPGSGGLVTVKFDLTASVRTAKKAN